MWNLGRITARNVSVPGKCYFASVSDPPRLNMYKWSKVCTVQLAYMYVNYAFGTVLISAGSWLMKMIILERSLCLQEAG